MPVRAGGGRLQLCGSITITDQLAAAGDHQPQAGCQLSAAGDHQPETVNRSAAIQQHNQKTVRIVPQLQHVPPAVNFVFRLARLERCDDATSDPVLLDGESLA